VTEIVFADRRDAGRRLGEALRSEGHVAPGALVAGIPRGGVVVAAEVARVTGAPLRAVLARKVGAPHRPELAIGAVGPDGTAIFDEELVVRLGATREWLAQAAEKERAVLAERAARLPAVLQRAEAEGRRVIVIDDGVATGATAAAVGAWLGGVGAARRVLALPVGPPATVAQLAEIYDDVVTLAQPSYFFAVGQWYRDFTQTTDDEVIELLSSYSAGGSGGA
jgi:putative phosphoribosyl transferase